MTEDEAHAQKVRIEYLEHVLFGIREVLRSSKADEPEKALRVISQRVGWALDGQEAPATTRTEILQELEDTVIQETIVQQPLGMHVELTLHQPGTVRLSFDPLGFVHGNQSRPDSETPDAAGAS